MTDKERLIELILLGQDHTPCAFEDIDCGNMKCGECEREAIADHLIANGVVVQKQGEWVVHQDNDGTWHFDCPFCDDGYAIKEKHAVKFCGNCGALLIKED